jgi:hypothetical protein
MEGINKGRDLSTKYGENKMDWVIISYLPRENLNLEETNVATDHRELGENTRKLIIYLFFYGGS